MTAFALWVGTAVAPRCSLEARKGLESVLSVLASDHHFDRTCYVQTAVVSLEKLTVERQRI